MLSREDNELLTRVGPGTAMGNLLRCFWQPFALASELPGADCDPLRVRLLGEDLVGFRDTSGAVGLIERKVKAVTYLGQERSGLLWAAYGSVYDIHCRTE